MPDTLHHQCTAATQHGGCATESRNRDYRRLYEEQCRKNKALHEELALLQTQTHLYARDLSNVYRHAKGKRQELAQVNSQLLKYAADLRNSIASLRKRNHDLTESYQDTLHRLAVAAEFRDEGTGGHIMRMAYFSAYLGEKAGMGSVDVRNLLHAAPMHDVGKIGIADSIMKKPARLNSEEFRIMQSHTTIGANILAGAEAGAAIIRLAHRIALWHHERWDGRGYPHGIAGASIPLPCRIVALADVFDALVSQRPYKEAFSLERTIACIRKSRGRQFDPELTDLFVQHTGAIIAILDEVNSGHPERVHTHFTTKL